MKHWILPLVAVLVLSSCVAPPSVEPESAENSMASALQSSSASEASSLPDEQATAEKAAAEQAAAEKAAAEKAAAEKAAAEKAAAEKAAAEQAAAEKAAAEKAAAEKAAAEKAAAEKAAAEKAAAEKAAAEKAAAEKAAAEKAAEQAAAEKAAEKQTISVTGTNFLSRVESAVLKKQNEEREALGLEPLKMDENLRSAARIRSRELYKNDMFAHTRPNGDSWETVLREDVAITFAGAGENLCMIETNDPSDSRATSASFWVQEWVNSPGHYKNMVRSEFTHAGVGIYCIEKDGMTYAYATTLYAYY